MTKLDFISKLHTRTNRDYVERVIKHNKAECASKAKQWGYDYWDGERQFGYGGMYYDGRWKSVAENMACYYELKAGDRILDVGCGKGFLLYEFSQLIPGIEVMGIDISKYGVENAKEEIRPFLSLGHCKKLPFEDGEFDFVYSINTFHNLMNFELFAALKEFQRVGRDKHYICVESYRDEQEKANLLYWQLTCESFYSPEEWQWFYDLVGYKGDVDYIFFE